MTEAVARGVSDLVGPVEQRLEVAYELQGLTGVIDLVAVAFDPAALDSRKAAGLGPVTLPLRMRTLNALPQNRVLRIETLARRVGSNSAALSRSTLKPLEEAGALESSRGRVRHTGAWRPIATSLTAIELKLSKWKKAVLQADNAAWSADRAWVVLDRAQAGRAPAKADVFRTFGVGLALMDRTGDLEVLVRPRLRPPVSWLRAWMAELAWAQVLAPDRSQ